ncbi:MAG: alpha-D-ribose 1-methylphosphonate 5-triphosphate diphosphatase [Burkholderiales bacterium]|nr:alpha-D-ribose 1-methylphosphonate 5-triphosphate diphosphatase [Burkholderiales bacterium]
MKTYLTHARVVLADEVLDDAAVLLEDDRIVAVNSASVNGAKEIDLQGRWLIPGLVDLHCDALEKEIEPRPNVHFPLAFAIANADKRNAAAGITTVYHALSFAHDELGVRNVELASDVARAIHAYRARGLVDNRVHARYEMTDPSGATVLARLIADGDLELLSFMDHTPGQGQYKTLEVYRDYIVRTYHRSRDEADRMAHEKMAGRGAAWARVEQLAALALRRGVRIASHDDDSAARVQSMGALGVSVSEFPINLEAARAARERGITTVFGAPNILRGASQSGSMRALEAVENGVADSLCADYAPAAMLVAAFKLPSVSALDVPAAVRLVTRSAARAVGLEDRGEIAPGLRADLVVVTEVSGFPQATHTWSAGRLAYRVAYGE